MRLEPFVALPLIGAFHFLNRVANEWSWRFELPAAGRAHPTLKTFFFNPYQLAGHNGRILHAHRCVGRTDTSAFTKHLGCPLSC